MCDQPSLAVEVSNAAAAQLKEASRLRGSARATAARGELVICQTRTTDNLLSSPLSLTQYNTRRRV